MAADLAAWVQAGRAAWPDLRVADDAVRAFFLERVDETTPEAVPATDLYLACACASGDARALAAFHTTFDPHVGAILGRLDVPAPVRDEARHALAAHLFVAAPGEAPRITGYRGRGPLLAYVRVTAIRLALSLARRERGHDELDDDLPAEQLDPELALLKERCRDELERAFAEAVAALAPRARTLLRFQLIDGLSIDRIAAVYGIHRSSAARQLVEARETLAASTQRILMRRLRMDRDDVASLLRLVTSRFDLSVTRLLTRE